MNKISTTFSSRIISIILFLLTIIVTIWLFHYLSNEDNRLDTFHFTLFYCCFIELIFYSYIFLFFVPSFKNNIVWAIYPSIGLIIGIYIAVSAILMVGHGILFIFLESSRSYYTSIVITNLIFLFIIGLTIILSIKTK